MRKSSKHFLPPLWPDLGNIQGGGVKQGSTRTACTLLFLPMLPQCSVTTFSSDLANILISSLFSFKNRLSFQSSQNDKNSFWKITPFFYIRNTTTLFFFIRNHLLRNLESKAQKSPKIVRNCLGLSRIF